MRLYTTDFEKSTLYLIAAEDLTHSSAPAKVSDTTSSNEDAAGQALRRL
jgi:hypothetical protein